LFGFERNKLNKLKMFYYRELAEKSLGRHARNVEEAEKLWNMSEEWTRGKQEA